MTSAKYAVRERERRFLLAAAPSGLTGGALIEDTYLPGTRLRLRRVTDADGNVVRKLGQKIREAGAESVLHTSIHLDEREWATLAHDGQVLRKRRFLVGDLPVAVDVFEGVWAGLVTAEVDLGDGPDRPDLPARLAAAGLEVVREVTGEDAYTGGALAAGGPDTPPGQSSASA
jgi:CYTH domain-containing protein